LPVGTGSELTDGDREKQLDHEFEQLQRDYPKITNRSDLCRNLLSSLDEEELALVRLAARGARIAKTRDKYQPIVALEKFLQNPASCRAFADLVPPPPKASTLGGPSQWLAEDSQEFRAVLIACAIARRTFPVPILPVGPGPWSGKGKRSIRYNGEIPGGVETFAALAADEQISTVGWVIAESGTQQFFAWSERVAEWIGRVPEGYRIWLDKNGAVVERADLAYRELREGQPEKWWIPKCKEGLLVPRTETGFPPPKGTGTGPPKSQSLASESELDPPFSKTG
jgi:hypothetical protein